MKNKTSAFRISSFAAMMILGVLLLTGCHGQRQMKSFEMPEEFDTSKTYEITFWAKNDSNKYQTEIYKKAIGDFEKLYPNINVTIRLYNDYGKIYNDVITNIATQTTPNVCITYPDHIATYISGRNTVVELDDLIEDPSYGFGGEKLLFDSPSKDKIVPRFLNECNFGGHYYALPFMRSTEIMYINETFVNDLGYELPDVLTWDFVFKVSEDAMKLSDDGTYAVNGQKVLIPFIYKSTDNMMITMLKQRDAGYSDDEGNVLIFNDDTRDILKQIAEHSKTGAFSTFTISGYPGNFLNAGQCIFAVDSSAGSTWMGPEAPLMDIHQNAICKFDIALRPVPQYDINEPYMMSQGPSICVFNKKDDQEVLASWLFAQYLLSNDVQIPYSETEGYIPVTIKAFDDPEYQDYLSRAGEDNNTHYSVKIQASRLLLDNMKYTFVTPVFNGSTSLRSASGAMIEETVKAARRKREVDDEFIDKIYSNVNSLYRLDQIRSYEHGKEDLGPMPSGAKALIIVLIIVWVHILGYVTAQKVKEKEHR